MIRRARAARFIFAAFALLAPSLAALSQPQTYRTIGVDDLVDARVPEGESVEAAGHAWFTGDAAYISFNQASARGGVRVDIAQVGPEESQRFQSLCRSPDQFRDGCWARMRGRIGRVGDQQSLVATEISSYRRIAADDRAGRAPDGERVEVVGQAWFNDAGGSAHIGRPTARGPMNVDISQVDPAESQRFKSACRGALGCQARMRGQTGMLGDRQGLIATEIEVFWRSINGSDIAGAGIPDGEWVEAIGHAWFTGDGAYMNINRPSARPPLRLDITHASEGRRFRSECRAPDQSRDGCRVRIEGRTGMVGDRQGVIAMEIEIIPQ